MSRTELAARASVGAPDAEVAIALTRPGAVSTSAFDRVIAAVDASHYLLTPSAVVTPDSAEEVAALFAWATEHGRHLTFRSGGTSLSGQASTDGVLVDTRSAFRSIAIDDDGRIARVGPGATVRQVNARLARHGRKLGPDPASEIACTIGGVVANNSSGMACGTAQNSYRTLRSMVVVLPGGTIIDTAAPDADARLRAAEPALWSALGALRARIHADPALVAEIERQFAIKNTMGYSLNAFVDHDEPVQVLAHLMVGSEGTLGFVAEATFETVPLLPHAATGLLVFESLGAATDALVDLIATGPATIELMDAASLRAAASDPESRDALPALDVVDHCALLVEFQAETTDELTGRLGSALPLLSRLPLATDAGFSSDPARRAALWHIRKGLYATVAGARPSGTTALLEDIAVPVAKLSETCAGLRRLFARYGYGDAVIFGHAKDGNVHFLITEDFENPESLERYRAFTEDLVDLVLSAGGTLKAEHGTGRIMAPFVERQYGPVLTGVMRELKRAIDPAGILGRDAVLSDDPGIHLKHLKRTPTVEAEVDRCVECGYCEPVCPSKDLTTTPRQRIVVRRAIAEADASGDGALARELRKAERYEVVDTCAVDGLCQTACPVRINTGDLVRRLRSEHAGGAATAAWATAGKHWGATTAVASTALTIAARVPALAAPASSLARAVLGDDTAPQWSRDLPKGGARRVELAAAAPDAVYFEACVGTMFGPADGSTGVAVAFRSLAEKAGIALVSPEGIDALCCGTPWKSKGMSTGHADMVERTAAALWNASRGGELPVVCDNSSCSEGLVGAVTQAVAAHPEYASLRIVDAVDFAAEHILPVIDVERSLASIVVHPTCSSTRAGSNGNLTALAAAVADEVTVPADWGCCAFAGDRGMLHPELTASATEREAAEVRAGRFDAHVSCNRTCELGMTRATGTQYEHVLEVVERAARSRT